MSTTIVCIFWTLDSSDRSHLTRPRSSGDSARCFILVGLGKVWRFGGLCSIGCRAISSCAEEMKGYPEVVEVFGFELESGYHLVVVCAVNLAAVF